VPILVNLTVVLKYFIALKTVGTFFLGWLLGLYLFVCKMATLTISL